MLTPCRECKHKIGDGASTCPSCGAPCPECSWGFAAFVFYCACLTKLAVFAAACAVLVWVWTEMMP